MSYIAAFHCNEGIVLCADTQETISGIEEHKQHSEKLYIVEDRSYPLAVGGAGVDELIDAFCQELFERAQREHPATASALKSTIQVAINTIYTSDIPVSVIPRQLRTPEFLIAAKPTDDTFTIFRLKGKRIYPVREWEIIGYATALNKALMRRLYRPQLPMQQAVLLSVYLVSQSKAVDTGVGGDTRVAIVASSGAWLDSPAYLQHAENRVREFFQFTDRLFLTSVDVSIPPSTFDQDLIEFSTNIKQLRQRHMDVSGELDLREALANPSRGGTPYPKVFLGAVLTATPGVPIKVREEPRELQEKRVVLERLASQNPKNATAGAELMAFLNHYGENGKRDVFWGTR